MPFLIFLTKKGTFLKSVSNLSFAGQMVNSAKTLLPSIFGDNASHLFVMNDSNSFSLEVHGNGGLKAIMKTQITTHEGVG